MTKKELMEVKFKLIAHALMAHEQVSTYASENDELGWYSHQPMRNGLPHGRKWVEYRIRNKIYNSKTAFMEALKDYQPRK